MTEAYICDPLRTAIGRYGGSLSSVRTDDLAALPLKALMARNPKLDWQAVDDVIMGCANQAGEDNRNVARMAALLSGLPVSVTGATINRLCGSGLDALATASRAVKLGEASMMIAGGVEGMSRAPFVMPKADSAFSRQASIEDTTLGWRFINKQMKKMYGVDSMPETAENVAEAFQISRQDQDAFAWRSQMRAKAAQESGRLAKEIIPVELPGGAINVRIPAGAQAGKQLRVRGKGLPSDPPGDLYIDLRIVAPPADTPRTKELYEALAKETAFDARKAPVP